MRSRKFLLFFASALLVCGALAGPCYAGTVVFNFEYSFIAPSWAICPGADGGVCDSVAASGALTTEDQGSGLYAITGITGQRTINGVQNIIIGLLGAGAFGSPSNYLYFPGMFGPGSQLLDESGFTYQISNSAGGNDGQGSVNVYSWGGYYYEYSDASYGGDFTVSLADQAVPEPATLGLLLAGSVCLGICSRRRRQ